MVICNLRKILPGVMLVPGSVKLQDLLIDHVQKITQQSKLTIECDLEIYDFFFKSDRQLIMHLRMASKRKLETIIYILQYLNDVVWRSS